MSEIQPKLKTGTKTTVKAPIKKVTKTPDKNLSVKGTAKSKKSNVTSDMDQFRHMVSEAAYYRAQKREFIGGDQNEDWFIAEVEIKQLFNLE